MAHIEDFGEKIGGARKDVWKLTGITANDLSQMNDMERSTHVKKDNIWIKPDWEQLIADGRPQALAYWQNKMRQSLPPKPPKDTEEAHKNYVSVVTQIRDAVMGVEDAYDIRLFFNDFLLPKFTTSSGSSRFVEIKPEASGIVTNKVLKAAQARYRDLEEEAEKKLFGVPKDERAYTAAKQGLEIYYYDEEDVELGYDPYHPENVRMTVHTDYGRSYFYLRPDDRFHDLDEWNINSWFVMGPNRRPLRINFSSREDAEAFVESYAKAAQEAANEKSGSKGNDKSDPNRKKHFVPRQLAHIKYTGPDYRKGWHANSKMYLENLKFRAGEFGNWLNNDDRQASMDMAYDALQNLATILNIRPEDVSLNGNLAIAFGARGRGGASAGAAHYEPLRQVINLTKMSGAGCLAHEWAHALDHAIGIEFGVAGFASEAKGAKARTLPESFKKVLESLKYIEADVSAEELRKTLDPKIQDAEKNLRGWIRSVKPSSLPEDLSKAWDEIEDRIVQKADGFTGAEYWSTSRRDPVLTHPDVEELSNICKYATKRVIPRSSKHQIALWGNEIRRFHESAKKMVATKRYVKTEYFNGSAKFDAIYSKYGHGYWQSDCEMFARAFDCYIADKVKELGYRSDYLSSNADSFIYRDGDKEFAAFPRGQERERINKAFDELFADLKERQMLHEPVEKTPEKVPEISVPPSMTGEPYTPIPTKKVRYEQLSLDDMLFSAASRANNQNLGKQNKQTEKSR